MIAVNVENLEILISKLSKLIEEYENNFLSIDREYDIIKENFKSKKMQLFYNELEDGKVKTKKVIVTLKEFLKLIQEIYNRYKEIGNNINIELDSKEIILNKQEEIKKNYERVINISNSLQESEEKVTVLREVIKIKKEEKKFLQIKNEIENFYVNIDNIENDIKAIIEKVEGGDLL